MRFVLGRRWVGDNSAIIPLMIGGAAADVTCRFLLKQSIMTERLSQRGLHVPQEFEADPLRRITVGTANSCIWRFPFQAHRRAMANPITRHTACQLEART